MPEAQASLRGYRAGGSKNIQKVDPPSGSTQANEPFHAVKGKYTDKGLNLTTSTEAHFALGVISQSRNPGWQDEPLESLDIPPLRSECSKRLRDLESKRQGKNDKGDKNPKEERKTRPEMSREQKLVGTIRDRTTTTSRNNTELSQTEPKKDSSIYHQKTRYDRVRRNV
jgi:hypothetical protein